MRMDHRAWSTVVVKGIIEAAMFLANICLAGMLVLVFLNVVLRYVFRQPLFWGDEIMTYLMMLIAFLGFGYMLMEDRHIKMTALIEQLPVRSQNIVRVLTSLLSIGYFALLLVAGLYVTIDSFQIEYFSMVTGLPIGPWQLAMSIGLAILLMASVWFTINRIRTARVPRERNQVQEHSLIQ